MIVDSVGGTVALAGMVARRTLRVPLSGDDLSLVDEFLGGRGAIIDDELDCEVADAAGAEARQYEIAGKNVCTNLHLFPTDDEPSA